MSSTTKTVLIAVAVTLAVIAAANRLAVLQGVKNLIQGTPAA